MTDLSLKNIVMDGDFDFDIQEAERHFLNDNNFYTQNRPKHKQDV